jgi:hypothetical protein
VPTQVQDELNAAQSYYEQALTALKAGDLGTYQSDINSMDSEIQAAAERLKAASGTSTTTATTTTTTTPAKKQEQEHTTKPKSPTTTEPKDSTTTTTLASAAAAAGDRVGRRCPWDAMPTPCNERMRQWDCSTR